jgi:hypothetical protein
MSITLFLADQAFEPEVIESMEFNDFLGDKSCCRIFANFQLQSVTRCYEGRGVRDPSRPPRRSSLTATILAQRLPLQS